MNSTNGQTAKTPEHLIIGASTPAPKDNTGGWIRVPGVDGSEFWFAASAFASFAVAGIVPVAAPAIVGVIRSLAAEIAGKDGKRGRESAEAFQRLIDGGGLAAISFDDALDRFRFAPGHPRLGGVYKRHPLGRLDQRRDRTAIRASTFIAIDDYDEILLDEREAELIRLLIDLGATKIDIEDQSGSQSHGGVSGGAKGMKVEARGESALEGTRRRTLRNQGRPMERVRTFSSDDYDWLPFESEWSSLVHARLEGGCVYAELILESSTSHGGGLGIDVDKVVDTSLKANRRKGVRRRVEVEFGAGEMPRSVGASEAQAGSEVPS